MTLHRIRVPDGIKLRAPATSRKVSQQPPSSLHAADFATPDRSDLKPARTSSEKSRGCSQAA
jgi:hypothetical protein